MSEPPDWRKFEQLAGEIQRELSDIDSTHADKGSVGSDHVEPKAYFMALEWNDTHPLEVFSTMLVS